MVARCDILFAYCVQDAEIAPRLVGVMKTNAEQHRIIVGVSGASGVIYGIRMLEVLRAAGIETHLVMSKSAEVTLAYESKLKVKDVRALAGVVYNNADIGAAISSGSFRTQGMIVAPCSIRTVSEIASGVTSSLLTRAADVVLKERRRLVLMVRESPLHVGHLRTLTTAAEIGAIIATPVPAFYTSPQTIDDIVNHTVGRALDLFGIDIGIVKRWGEPAVEEDAQARQSGKPKRTTKTRRRPS
jgi:flavin prenyltransferase